MNALESFLTVDPRDAGCERTLELLHVYVEDVLAGATRTPGSSRTCARARPAPRTSRRCWARGDDDARHAGDHP